MGTDTVNGQATGVFYFDGVEKPIREFERGATYFFNQNDSSNSTWNNQSHPLMFSTTADGDHNGNGHYMMGVTYKLDGVVKTMAEYVSGFGSATRKNCRRGQYQPNAPNTLWYWCHFHTGQGNSMTMTDQYTDIGGATSPTYNTGTQPTLLTMVTDSDVSFRLSVLLLMNSPQPHC